MIVRAVIREIAVDFCAHACRTDACDRIEVKSLVNCLTDFDVLCRACTFALVIENSRVLAERMNNQFNLVISPVCGSHADRHIVSNITVAGHNRHRAGCRVICKGELDLLEVTLVVRIPVIVVSFDDNRLTAVPLFEFVLAGAHERSLCSHFNAACRIDFILADDAEVSPGEHLQKVRGNGCELDGNRMLVVGNSAGKVSACIGVRAVLHRCVNGVNHVVSHKRSAVRHRDVITERELAVRVINPFPGCSKSGLHFTGLPVEIDQCILKCCGDDAELVLLLSGSCCPQGGRFSGKADHKGLIRDLSIGRIFIQTVNAFLCKCAGRHGQCHGCCKGNAQILFKTHSFFLL